MLKKQLDLMELTERPEDFEVLMEDIFTDIFERMYREDDRESIAACMDHTLSVMRVAEALRKDAGIVFPCDEKEFV